MHNCRETIEQVTELLLDGANSRPDEVLLGELRKCVECRNEFDALKATLRMTTISRELSAPTEAYWTTYHAKLRHKLVNVNAVNNSPEPSLVTRFFRFSIPVPAPLALALILVGAVLVPIAIRASRQQAPSVVRVPVEVPVVQEKEKIVTRVVYRERQRLVRTANRLNNAPKVENTFAQSKKPRDVDVPPGLAGFKPTEEVKLTVIKGGSTNEK